MDDTNVHKGILVTTNGFQKGTLTFAKSKGIALALFDPNPLKLKIVLNAGDNPMEMIRGMALYKGLHVALLAALDELDLKSTSEDGRSIAR